MTGGVRIRWRAALGGLVLLGLTGAPASAQTEVSLEKATNGRDADVPPGPVLLAGDPVVWTYRVTNTGSRDLVGVAVTDDQGVAVTCPAATLPAGESMVCTGNGTAEVGQYANVGTVTAELPNGALVEDSDPSHYFGQAEAVVDLEKATNGQDADLPPGPILPAGAAVAWTYTVTNLGSETLSGIEVADDQGVVVTCPQTTLAAGASLVCTANGTAQPGQHANIGTVTASLPDESTTGDSDPSHYFGQVLSLQKSTNGVDADLPPGPVLPFGAAVAWTYEVANPGPATVSGLAVTDDQGVAVSCPGTVLAAGESMTCTGNGTAQPGQYANVGTATGQLPGGAEISASDPSHYLGQALVLEKSTNGEDADLPPGPVLAPGAAVTWTYTVTNLGSVELTEIAVSDDQGVAVTCPGTTLAAGASMVCTGNGVAQAGQYANLGTVTALDESEGELSASDPSHYFGQDQVLDFGDAAEPPYLTRFAALGARHRLGSGVYLGACVDAELDGQPSAGADGDDAGAGLAVFGTCAAAGDDEDGVAFTTPLIAGAAAEVAVTAHEACTLSAWIDWNADGDWSDPGEDVAPGGAALAAGVNPLAIAVPPAALLGATRARFRCTTAGAVPFTGEAADGEVEDYAVAVVTPAAVTAAKTAALAVDQDGDGLADAGDTLEYTVVLLNSGGAPAAGVTFADTPDPNTALVNGSVATTAGTVTGGNGAGETTAAVDVGTLAAGGTATITLRVTIDDPLPEGVTQVANQGLVTGDGLAGLPTDDPARPGAGDPTVVPVGAPSILEVPAVGEWGLLLLALLLGVLGVRRLLAAG